MSSFSVNTPTPTNKRKLDVFIGFQQTIDQLNELSSQILEFCKIKHSLIPSLLFLHHTKSVLINFLCLTPNDFDQALEYLELFVSSPVPKALVKLYLTQGYGLIAFDCIFEFVHSLQSESLAPMHAFILLKFCKILGEDVTTDDALYFFCRSCLGSMIKSVGVASCKDDTKKLVSLNDVFPFVCEMAAELGHDLDSTMGSTKNLGLSYIVVRDFTSFMLPVWNVLRLQIPLIDNDTHKTEYIREIFIGLNGIFCNLLEKMESSLLLLGSKKEGEVAQVVHWWSYYLDILKDLHNISKLYTNAENDFWHMMEKVKDSLCILIYSFAEESKSYEWLFDHKEATNFYIRRKLAMMMLPEVEDDEEDQHYMLIDRSKLLVDSFEYIAKLEYLPVSLFVEFKEEQATGPGVLRAWFFLVCQEIFNPNNALFVACPDDNRRFYPNQASEVNPLHLEYFRFSGRMIALALSHDVQIGVVFDRVFFLQLAKKNILLEDIRDADPVLYSSCKMILSMDADTVDQDVLGLTFVHEVESLGSRNVIELCPNGKDIVVDSKNRETYINLLIQHRFVTSISEQVAHFSEGFSDVITTSRFPSFFRCLSLEDFNLILGGRSNISVEDWKAHTDYNGYEESDRQISWFWKIVENMSVEQRKMLLFFWTSIKSLPFEGFGGLDERLSIYKTSESDDHLPSSHTCFFRLCFPVYQSMEDMKDRLWMITQEHIGSSFGTS